MGSGTAGGRKQLLRKGKPRKMETKNEIKEKPQPFMLLWPLDMAIHEFTAVEQRLWWFSPECQASSSLGGTCFSDLECLGQLLVEGGGAAASAPHCSPRPCSQAMRACSSLALPGGSEAFRCRPLGLSASSRSSMPSSCSRAGRRGW